MVGLPALEFAAVILRADDEPVYGLAIDVPHGVTAGSMLWRYFIGSYGFDGSVIPVRGAVSVKHAKLFGVPTISRDGASKTPPRQENAPGFDEDSSTIPQSVVTAAKNIVTPAPLGSSV